MYSGRINQKYVVLSKKIKKIYWKMMIELLFVVLMNQKLRQELFWLQTK